MSGGYDNSVGGASPLTTKGDLYGYSSADARIPVGTNGQVLTADSAQTLGVKWATPTGIASINADTTSAQTIVAGAGMKVATAAGATTVTAIRSLMQFKIVDDSTLLVVGDGQLIFCIPSELNGYNLTGAQAYVTTVSSSGLPNVQVRNVTTGFDMLSTPITIDVSEFTSYTAATPPVIDLARDDVATGNRIAIDIDAAGTGTKGLGILLTFQLP